MRDVFREALLYSGSLFPPRDTGTRALGGELRIASDPKRP